MSANVHPDHVETHDELQKAIDNPTELTDAEMTKALDTLVDMLSSAESEKQFMDEIEALTKGLAFVLWKFRVVENLFNRIKNSKNSEPLKNDVDGLLETRMTHQKTYLELMRAARSAAVVGESAAKDFAHDFTDMLADDTASLESKKVEIQACMKKLDSDKSTSEEVAKTSLELTHSVSSFYQDWRRVVDSHILDADADHVREMDKELDTLEATLQDLTDKVSQLSQALKAPTAGIVGVLGIINPIFMIGKLVQALDGSVSPEALDAALAEQKEVIAKINAKEGEREQALADLHTEQELQATLNKSHIDLTNICNKLTALGTVWSAIRADLQAIEEKLDYTVGTSSQSLFKARLRTAAKLYEMLGKALNRYQEAPNVDELIDMLNRLSSFKFEGFSAGIGCIISYLTRPANFLTASI